jgi:hypothetical protein
LRSFIVSFTSFKFVQESNVEDRWNFDKKQHHCFNDVTAFSHIGSSQGVATMRLFIEAVIILICFVVAAHLGHLPAMLATGMMMGLCGGWIFRRKMEKSVAGIMSVRIVYTIITMVLCVFMLAIIWLTGIQELVAEAFESVGFPKQMRTPIIASFGDVLLIITFYIPTCFIATDQQK